MLRRTLSLLGATAFAVLVVPSAQSYSVLTHEAIVDSAWDTQIRPMLLARFPNASEEELREAHAYVYGGSLVADMGYMPLSSRFFSDLLHYVRSGAFVETLLRQSQTVNQYAFALGALAHYVADRTGHPVINRITPLVYPKLEAKFGPVVTYEDHRTAHLKTEFGLDVIQLARGKYAPDSYRDFIGFEIDEDALKRAFETVYGIELKDVVSSDVAIGTYRFMVGKVIPEMTQVAWENRRKEIEKLTPGIERNKFVYGFTRADYEKRWGREYKRPGVLARLLAFGFKLVPPVGPFAGTRFRVVPEQGEQMFLQAFQSTVAEYRKALDGVRGNRLSLANENLDTGMPTRPGEYEMADKAYAKLAKTLDDHHFDRLSASLRNDILTFFASAQQKPDGKKLTVHLRNLRQASTAGENALR